MMPPDLRRKAARLIASKVIYIYVLFRLREAFCELKKWFGPRHILLVQPLTPCASLVYLSALAISG